MNWDKNQMADEVISFFKDGDSVNLGIGMPTLVASRVPKKLDIMIHSENGILGVGPSPKPEQVSPTLINAGKETITSIPGASYFDSSLSFGMIRGGHIDYCVLGAMEVDVEGSLANWMIPGKKVTGMGGAMDLVNGAKNVIIMMSHFNKNGETKLKQKCTLPLTGKSVVNFVITELGVFKVENNHFKVLKYSSKDAKNTLNSLKLYRFQ